MDGREKDLKFLLSTSLINTENRSKVIDSIQDITERKETEKELKESEERFRTLTEKAADAIIAHDFDGNIVYANETASKNLGYSRDEMLSLNVIDIDPYVDVDVFRDKYWNKTSSDTSYFIGTYHKRKDGTIFPVEVRLTRINLNEKPVILAYIRDITVRKQAEERLKEQKEQVIETERIRQLELHHRIKNNLQIISSLLNLQSEKFTDDNVKDAFIDTRNRVISMSLVHNKLYQAKGLENVNTKDYIGDLVDHLNELYNVPNIDINIDVEDIYLGIDTIIPLGMLINEILSNSLKYAFSESETGKIEIKLYQNNNKNYTLIVADNGKGMPENIDVKDADTLGLQLIKSLIDQIGGDFEVNKENGTKYIIKFSS
ncbi:sensor histidine kinase [Methanohalobium sp.]|uniref:sensor histidine kinase n=1 Tax=Methanohalobium sp. TaxID=2837493 RepID=UPI0025DD32FE|nr:PAS domain S-box protein [Methanohalobium sp.]